MAKVIQSPGAFLALMLEKYKLSPLTLAKDIKLSQPVVRLITAGKAKITTPIAVRLAKYFNTNPEFWLAMQMKWDVAEASKDKALVKVVKGISRVSKPSAGSGRKSASAKKAAPAKKKPATKKKTTKKAPKKTRLSKKPRLQKKAAARKRAVAKRKPVTRKKPRLLKKPRLQKKAARKTAAQKPARGRKKTVGRRGRPAKK